MIPRILRDGARAFARGFVAGATVGAALKITVFAYRKGINALHSRTLRSPPDPPEAYKITWYARCRRCGHVHTETRVRLDSERGRVPKVPPNCDDCDSSLSYGSDVSREYEVSSL